MALAFSKNISKESKDKHRACLNPKLHRDHKNMQMICFMQG
jgi:hypothetical protein